jgi:hypothetical protein
MLTRCLAPSAASSLQSMPVATCSHSGSDHRGSGGCTSGLPVSLAIRCTSRACSDVGRSTSVGQKANRSTAGRRHSTSRWHSADRWRCGLGSPPLHSRAEPAGHGRMPRRPIHRRMPRVACPKNDNRALLDWCPSRKLRVGWLSSQFGLIRKSSCASVWPAKLRSALTARFGGKALG